MGIPKDFKPANVFDPEISRYFHNMETEHNGNLQNAYERCLTQSMTRPTDPAEKKKLAQKFKNELTSLLFRMKEGLGTDAIVNLYSNDNDLWNNDLCFYNSCKLNSLLSESVLTYISVSADASCVSKSY